MTRTAKVLLTLALCLLAGAGFMWHKFHTNADHNWRLLQQPVQFNNKPGLVLSAPLEAEFTGQHLVELDLDRKLPLHELNCLLGTMPAAMEPCDAAKGIAAIQWTVHDGQTLVASGSTAGDAHPGGYWGPTVGRELGQFQATAGARYTLHVESAAQPEALNQANPKIVVEVGHDRFKQAFVQGYIAATAAQVLTGLGALMLCITGLVVWLQRRRSRKALTATPPNP